MPFGLSMQHQGHRPNKVRKHYDLPLILTFFMERSNVFTETPKTLQIILSETRRSMPLIFDM